MMLRHSSGPIHRGADHALTRDVGGFARIRRTLLIGVLLLLGQTLGLSADPSPPGDGIAALQMLRTFASTGRVLHVGAHPDDENTQLIAYLSRGRAYDTAYLSITRGDGGQNLLGPDFDEKLGVARTQELLAARRIDGGRQFFTRAIDFGFSKTPEETLSIWNHHEVLGDVVRIIRRFRPDVIVTRFPVPPGSGGHGHHTASAILAVEAFKLAGDAKAYPEQLQQGLKPWQPKRIVWNTSGFSRGGGLESRPSVKVDIGGNDPVTGEAFGAIAGRSRAMHKTQGFGDFGSRSGSGPRVETFVLLDGAPAEKDFMDGIDPTWARVQGGAEIGSLADAAVAHFDMHDAAASVPTLLTIRRKLAELPDDTIVADKRAQLERVIEKCLGLEIATRAESLTVVPGETLPVTASARQRTSLPLVLREIVTPAGTVQVGTSVSASIVMSRGLRYPVAKTTPVTQPYWLRKPPTTGMYQVDDPSLIGLPSNPPDLPLTYVFEINGQRLAVVDELTHAAAAAAENATAAPAHDRLLPVAVIPRVALRFSPGAAVFRPGATTIVNLDVVAGRPNVSGSVQLDAPPGWRVSPAQPFSIAREIGTAKLAFEVTAPTDTAVAMLGARARTGDEEWHTDAFTVHYAHIPTQLLQPPARKRVVSVLVGTRGHSVGYIAGAGDDVPDALRQLGYQVTTLNGGGITVDKLKGFDAVVVGVRAFNTRSDLATVSPALFTYVENGGTVVCQYNWARNLKTDQIAPYRLKLSDSRVTNEDAPVTFLAPDHAVLNSPNKITAVDFNGWVQERGVYFPTEWDEHFVPILAMSDRGEAPLQGGLLVAQYGKGHFVYTSLAFFRQLPAGVPGAYRLFANLVSLGK